MKSGVGSWKSEAGSWKSEVGEGLSKVMLIYVKILEADRAVLAGGKGVREKKDAYYGIGISDFSPFPAGNTNISLVGAEGAISCFYAL